MPASNSGQPPLPPAGDEGSKLQPKTKLTRRDAPELIEGESLDLLVTSGVLTSSGSPRVTASFPAQVVRIGRFLDLLANSQLAPPAEIELLRSRFTEEDLGREAETLARELVTEGILTEYQASVLMRGDSNGLVYGDFVVLENLGSGGMAFVLKACHRVTGRVVALKVMHLDAARTAEGRERFARECQALAHLQHPNVVAVFDVYLEGDAPYLTMEFVDGPDLGDLVKRSGVLPWELAVMYVVQAARGLEFAHSQGVVHRDVKPDNLLVDSQQTIKILDMGLARFDAAIPLSLGAGSGVERLTVQDAVLGTPNYMAPEQFIDPRNADRSADIYSLGYTLYFLLTGKKPFMRPTAMETLKAHLSDPIPPLNDGRDDVPAALTAIYERMVAKKPPGRYASMAEAADALEALVRANEGPPADAAGEARGSALGFFRRWFGKKSDGT